MVIKWCCTLGSCAKLPPTSPCLFFTEELLEQKCMLMDFVWLGPTPSYYYTPWTLSHAPLILLTSYLVLIFFLFKFL